MNALKPIPMSMKEAMKQALQQYNTAPPSIVSVLIELLGEAQEALREGGYTKAILELRRGLQTDYGMRWTAYLLDEGATFENPLFSVFVGDQQCAFQSEGRIEHHLNADAVSARVRDYLLQPYVIDLMTGLLRQFDRNASVPAVGTSVTTP